MYIVSTMPSRDGYDCMAGYMEMTCKHYSTLGQELRQVLWEAIAPVPDG